MSNWLELRAAQDAVFDRHGAEVWRTLRDAICAVVDSFNAIYCSRGTRDFECSECAQMSETCVRIRSIPPPGQHEPYVELRFKSNAQSHSSRQKGRNSCSAFLLRRELTYSD
jgi:hypothetical protein